MLHTCKEQYEDRECKMAQEISDMVNSCSNNLRANAEYFARFEHRYLQSELMQFAVHYIKELAENGKKGLYDGRNEWACLLSVELEKVIDNFVLPRKLWYTNEY